VRFSTIAGLTTVALIAGAVGWRSMHSDPIEVTLAAVERGRVRSTVSNTRAGTVEACSRARLAPTRGGQIAALPVKEGDTVKAGQILLELWNDDIRASLQLAAQERETAVARAEETCISADVSQREADRLDRLHAQNLTSEEAVDAARGMARARRAACQAARSTIRVSDAQIAVIAAQLEQTVVRAPFAGTIAEINGEVGEVVTPSPVGVPTLPAVDLIDNSCLYVSAPIDEVDAPRIRAGMPAIVTLDAFPGETFAGTVRRVAPYVLDLEKQARTVDIEAELDQPSTDLLPGYSADVEITLAQHEDVLHIPTQAVMDGGRVLILTTSGLLEERVVETGLGNWEVTEIVSGLGERDRVVLSVDRAGVVDGAAAVASDDSS
jgi:HlyD family secretion protein